MIKKSKSFSSNRNDELKENAFQIQEAYKTIRTNLMFSLASSHTVLFTSYEPNAGKSVSIANVASSMAQTGARVLLIDADMRNASQHRIFRVQNSNGLSNVLGGISSLSDNIIIKDVADNLDLLSAGPIPPNPSELLGSERMGALLSQLGREYSYIFVDAPPVGAVSDTLSLYAHFKNTVIVARERQSKYRELQRLIDQIKALGANVCGFIVTNVTPTSKRADRIYAKKNAKYIKASLGYSDDE